MPSSLTFSVFDAALMTPAEPRASTALLAFSPVDAERAAVPDRGAVSFTTVYSASVMSSRLPQRLTTPCEPVLRDASVLDDAVEVLRVGPLGAAELLDADGAGVSCCGATPWSVGIQQARVVAATAAATATVTRGAAQPA